MKKSTNAGAPTAGGSLGVQNVQASQSSGIELSQPTESKPQQYAPGQLVDALHTAFGTHRARAVHAKGIILQGVFTPDSKAKALTTAAHLQDTESALTVRFSNFNGLPDIPDNSPSANPRGLAVKFTMPDGLTTDIVGQRYQFVPEGGEQLLTADEVARQSAGYLASEIRTRVGKYPFRFEFVAQLSEPGDPIADPSIAWPDTRTRVRLGTLEIRALAPNTVSEDRALSFSPDNLPDGIKPADPMVTFRSRAYPISVKERQ